MSNSLGYFQQGWLYHHPGKPIPMLTCPHGKEFFFLTSRWNFPWATCAWFLLSCASLYLHLLYKPLLKHLKTVTRLPSAFSSLGWKKNPIPSAFLSSCIKFFNPLSVLVALCWTLSSFTMSLWNWGSKAGTQYSRCGLTRAGEENTSPDLLATLLLTQPKAQFALFAARVHCQLHVLSDEGGKGATWWCGSFKKSMQTCMRVYLGVAGN